MTHRRYLNGPGRPPISSFGFVSAALRCSSTHVRSAPLLAKASPKSELDGRRPRLRYRGWGMTSIVRPRSPQIHHLSRWIHRVLAWQSDPGGVWWVVELCQSACCRGRVHPCCWPSSRTVVGGVRTCFRWAPARRTPASTAAACRSRRREPIRSRADVTRGGRGGGGRAGLDPGRRRWAGGGWRAGGGGGRGGERCSIPDEDDGAGGTGGSGGGKGGSGGGKGGTSGGSGGTMDGTAGAGGDACDGVSCGNGSCEPCVHG